MVTGAWLLADDTKCKDVFSDTNCHNGGCGQGYQWAENCQMECILLDYTIDLISCRMGQGIDDDSKPTMQAP